MNSQGTRSAAPVQNVGRPATTSAGLGAPAREGVIEMRVESLDRLFDAADPSPFGQQDLSPWAAEYIFESLKETEALDARSLTIIVAGASHSFDDAAIESAVRHYFARQATLRRRSLRRLLRRGVVTLGIGLVFLVTFFGVSHGIAWLLGDSVVATLMREGSLIVGWVAMWRPIEIFLFDWWPIVGERRLYDRLSQMSVRVVRSSAVAAPERAVAAASHAAARAIQRWETDGGRTQGPPTGEAVADGGDQR